jgi:hypothetical protein
VVILDGQKSKLVDLKLSPNRWKIGKIEDRCPNTDSTLLEGLRLWLYYRQNVVNLFHVNFKMISAFENLSTLFARVRYKSTLMLMPHVSKKCTLQVEATVASQTLILDPIGGLTHGVNGVLLGRVKPLQSLGSLVKVWRRYICG